MKTNFFFLCLILIISTLSPSSGISSRPTYHRRRVTPMHKVQLTQRGYIQFLRWELPVPEIEEFTFCLWVNSENLTHPHSIFSYSKNERERLIRAWISSGGRSVNLEISGAPIFAVASDIHEHRWYHVCQSWENQDGRYALWIDGRVKVQGHSLETLGHKIPSGGDIVVGQEYTDFDKGFEDGIEGTVTGFNLLLASSFTSLARNYQETPQDSLFASSVSNYMAIPFLARVPMKIMAQDGDTTQLTYVSYPVVRPTRSINFDSTSPGKKPFANSRKGLSELYSESLKSNRTRRDTLKIVKSNDSLKGIGADPLGLQLIKLSYVRCEIGRGSPFIGGSKMLISWTRTPVRIVGGATVKNARNVCGNF